MRASFPALVIVGALILGPNTQPVAAQDGLFERETLTGDWGGVRKQWRDAGVEIGLSDIAETLSNPTGGIRRLTIYQGLLTASLNLDLEKIANWRGASFYTDAFQISGRGLSRNAIGNLLAVSTIEALPSTRLHDLWLQQQLLDGKASFRLGQIFTSANTRPTSSIRRSAVRIFCRPICRAGGHAIRSRHQECE
ncbi:MAG: hypothetical protein E6G90_02570 [Alphaproteobacteria bacterium]|nr:MAG: hypothetical protein E6G90_02570 [Alphaproteobacteria bacterium]